MRNRNALTIIDVVVVVIIVVAFIVFLCVPLYRIKKETARRTSCISNLKNIGLLCKMYCQENNEVWPYEETKGNNARQNLYLLFVTDVADNAEVFLCPSSDTRPLSGITMPADLANSDYAYLDGPAESYEDAKLSLKLVMGDGWKGHSNPTLGNWTHDTGSNTLWGDGHVKRVQAKYVGIAPGSSWPDVK